MPLIDYKTVRTQLIQKNQKVAIRKGDLLVSTQQKGRKYLLETLEPHANNSFMHTGKLPFLPTPKDSLWVYPIFSIEK